MSRATWRPSTQDSWQENEAKGLQKIKNSESNPKAPIANQNAQTGLMVYY